MKASDFIAIDPEIMGGTPCFRGTRVPVKVLFVNLAAGVSLETILEEWPSIPRDAAEALLRLSQERMLEEASTELPRDAA